MFPFRRSRRGPGSVRPGHVGAGRTPQNTPGSSSPRTGISAGPPDRRQRTVGDGQSHVRRLHGIGERPAHPVPVASRRGIDAQSVASQTRAEEPPPRIVRPNPSSASTPLSVGKSSQSQLNLAGRRVRAARKRLRLEFPH